MDLVSLYQSHRQLIQPLLYMKNRLFSLRIRGGRGNQVLGVQGCLMKRCRITFSGTGNVVSIGDMSTLYDAAITICGSGNRITLGQRVSLMGCTMSVEDNANTIEIGSHTYIYQGTELAAIEGTRITLGEDCLLSSDIVLRTGDSHSILNADGRRINPSADITLGDHVWIGKGATVLKKARIGSGCVVGTGSLVTGSTEPVENAILAGSPAVPLRRDIRWERERLPAE